MDVKETVRVLPKGLGALANMTEAQLVLLEVEKEKSFAEGKRVARKEAALLSSLFTSFVYMDELSRIKKGAQR